MREEDEKFKSFIRDYLTENDGKIDSGFIKKYLSTGATIEYFAFRANMNNPEFVDDENIMQRVNLIMNAYMNGIEGQNVSDCDFSSLTQEEFEMIRFDEDTIFNEETIAMFHPDKILERRNTQIQNQVDGENMIHIAILDGPIAENDKDSPNLIIKNYVDESIPVTDSHHGRSVYSIFSSVNPNCVVHFYGTEPYDDEKDSTEDRAEALRDIIAYNSNCTDDSKKIRLISCSHNLLPEERELIESNNLNVISADNLHHGDFFEYFKFDESDVIPSLTEEEKEDLLERYAKYPFIRNFIGMMDSIIDNAVLVNVNLAIDQHFKKIKRHECDIAISWGVPVVAAYYATALRANPNMNYEEFHDICKKSLKEGTNILDEELFMENVKLIEQEKLSSSEPKKRSLLEDYPESIESGKDLSYRLGTIHETTKAIRADIVREEKEQNNDGQNIE